MTDPLRTLRISFGADEDDADSSCLTIPLVEQGSPHFLSIGGDVPVALPSGETIGVYAEVGLGDDVADVSISVVEGERVTAVRCGRGAVLSYTTLGGCEVLLQVGTGAWES
jgi:hypothetical protein